MNLLPKKVKLVTFIKFLDNYRNIFFLMIYTLIVFRVAFPQPNRLHQGVVNLPITSTPEEIRKAWGYGDSGSLLEVAITWANFKNLDEVTQYWIVRLWSPGFAIIEVPLIWLSKIGLPLFISMFFITYIVWVITLKKIIFQKYISLSLSLIVVAVLSISWDARYFFYEGVFYTEAVAYALLLTSLTMLSNSIISGSIPDKKYCVIIGSLLGMSIWVRHTSDYGLFLAILLFIVFFLKNLIFRFSEKFSKKKSKQIFKSKASENSMLLTKRVFLSLLLALAVTVPWRLISTYVFTSQPIPIAMSISSAGVGPGLWTQGSKDNPYYWEPYGGNWACKVDPITCEELQPVIDNPVTNSKYVIEAIRSAIINPLDYVQIRATTLLERWIPGFNNQELTLQDILSLLPLVLFFYSLSIWRKIKSKRKYLLASLWGAFLLAHTAPLLIIHYESRYFIAVRLLLLGFAIAIIRLWKSEGVEEVKVAY